MLKHQVHHLTINPHPNDINMFEEILEELPEFLNSFENWFYNIEKDNTDQRHAHIILHYSGKARFDNRSRKLRKYLMERIVGKSSKQFGNKGFLCQSHPVDDHNKKMVLGYAAKDLMEENRTAHSCDAIFQLCKDNVPYWQKHVIEVKKKNFKDIIIVKNTTAVCQILNYINEHKIELDPTIFDTMTHDHGYSFVCMSVKTKRDVYLELKVHLETSTAQDKSEAMCQWIHNPDEQNLLGELLYAKETKQFHIIQGWYNN